MMNQNEFLEQAKTFPWTRYVGRNGLVAMIDKNGREVPLFTVTDTLSYLSRVVKVEIKDENEKG